MPMIGLGSDNKRKATKTVTSKNTNNYLIQPHVLITTPDTSAFLTAAMRSLTTSASLVVIVIVYVQKIKGHLDTSWLYRTWLAPGVL